MKHFKKISLTFVWLCTLGLIVSFVASPHKALAIDIPDADFSKICIPPYKAGTDKDHHAIDKWLTAGFISRAQIRVEYRNTSTCPPGGASDIFFGNLSFDSLFGKFSGQPGALMLTDNNTGDGQVDYRLQVGDSSNDDSRINNFPGGFNNLYTGSNNRGDAIVNTSDLSTALKQVEILLGFEEDTVGDYGCGGDAKANYNFVLVDGSSPKWICTNSDIGGKQGFQIGQNTFDPSSLDNFNITYDVINAGNNNLEVRHVAPELGNSRTFTWCGGSQYLNKQCIGSDLELFASQDQIKNLNGDKGVFPIGKPGSKPGNDAVDVMIVGVAHPVSKAAAVQSGAIAGNCGSPTSPGCLGNLSETTQCVTASSIGLEWLLCPIITSISKFTDVINGYVEDQLHFRVDTMLPDSGEVNKAWSIIKNIVASMLVIIMLVMVLSQAIGRGPFEAYTVKKILPRLVIAVIAMQFSWVLTKFMINVANEFGVGIKQIMLAPFGGGGNLDLPSILHHLNPAYTGTSEIAIWALLLLLIGTFSTFITPLVLFIALALGSALFVAMITLVFRNILLIMSVIFSPLALLFWVLPGQTFQSYWKKYFDNFIKLLLLFPLVMGVIYAGRIVAHLGGNIGLPGLIDYLVVLIAFFGPYFYLPKTFKWGGSMLAGVNQAINSNKALNATNAWLSRRIKAETARRSAVQGAKWAQNDDYIRAARFDPKSKLGKKLFSKRVGYALDANGNQVEVRAGRRNFSKLSGRKIYGLAGGAFFDKGLSNEGMLKRSEEQKHTADTAAETRRRRRIESGREGKTATIGWSLDKKGNVVATPYAVGKKNSISAGIVAAMHQINSPFWRDDGEAAKLLMHPEVGTYASMRVPMDPTNRMWKKRQALEKRFGLDKVGAYNADHPSGLDSSLQNRLDALSGIPEANRTPAEKEEKESLETMFALRKGNVQELSGKEIKKVKDHIKTLKATDPGALEKATEGPWKNVHEDGTPMTEDEKIYFVPFTRHPALQKKATSTPELTQAIAGIDPLHLPIVMSKWSEAGGVYDDDPNAPIGELQPGSSINDAPKDRRFKRFNWKDMYSYFIGDHDSMQREAGINESVEKDFAIRAARGRKNYDIGKMGYNKQGEVALFAADERARLYLRNLERQDSATAQVLSLKMGVASTKEPFDEGFSEGMLNPGDLIGHGPDNINLVQRIGTHPAEEPYRAAQSREMFKMRRQMGIADNDARKITSRDFLIAQETPRYRYYDPSWTAEDTRNVFDAHIDPYNAGVPVYIAPSPETLHTSLPQDFLPEAVSETSRQAEYETGQRANRRGNPSAPTIPYRTALAYQALATTRDPDPQQNKQITDQQAAELERAHQVGRGEVGDDGTTPARFGNYTPAQKFTKGRILLQAGFTRPEAQLLLDQGIAGDPGDNPSIDIGGADSLGRLKARLTSSLNREPSDVEIQLSVAQAKFKDPKLDATARAAAGAEVAQLMAQVETPKPAPAAAPAPVPNIPAAVASSSPGQAPASSGIGPLPSSVPSNIGSVGGTGGPQIVRQELKTVKNQIFKTTQEIRPNPAPSDSSELRISHGQEGGPRTTGLFTPGAADLEATNRFVENISEGVKKAVKSELKGKDLGAGNEGETVATNIAQGVGNRIGDTVEGETGP